MPNPGLATPLRAASRTSVTHVASAASLLIRFGSGQAGRTARRTGAGLRPEEGHLALNGITSLFRDTDQFRFGHMIGDKLEN